MKIITSLFCLVLVSLTGYSQLNIPVGSKSDINKFLKNKTYIVLKNDRMSEYNFAVKDAIEKHWDITEFEFIYEPDFKKMQKDNDKSFLMINQVYFDKDKTQTLFDFIILTNGGNYKTVNDMPTLCAVPLCYNGALESDYDYKIALMIKHIQTHIRICKDNPSLNSDNIADYYLSKSGSPKTKTFYLLKEEVAPEIRTKNSFAGSYPFNFEYTSKENISSIIKNNDDNALILHVIGPQMKSSLSFCIKIIIDSEKGMIYYWDYHKINKKNYANLLKSDLKKFAAKK
jgi:hypothetical protein